MKTIGPFSGMTGPNTSKRESPGYFRIHYPPPRSMIETDLYLLQLALAFEAVPLHRSTII